MDEGLAAAVTTSPNRKARRKKNHSFPENASQDPFQPDSTMRSIGMFALGEIRG